MSREEKSRGNKKVGRKPWMSREEKSRRSKKVKKAPWMRREEKRRGNKKSERKHWMSREEKRRGNKKVGRKPWMSREEKRRGNKKVGKKPWMSREEKREQEGREDALNEKCENQIEYPLLSGGLYMSLLSLSNGTSFLVLCTQLVHSFSIFFLRSCYFYNSYLILLLASSRHCFAILFMSCLTHSNMSALFFLYSSWFALLLATGLHHSLLIPSCLVLLLATDLCHFYSTILSHLTLRNRSVPFFIILFLSHLTYSNTSVSFFTLVILSHLILSNRFGSLSLYLLLLEAGLHHFHLFFSCLVFLSGPHYLLL